MSWLLLVVTALALTACDGAADVAVEDATEPAPATPAAPQPAPAAPDAPEPAPAPGETSPDQPASADDRSPAASPPPDPAGEVANGDAPPASPEGEQPASADTGSTARGDAAAGNGTSKDKERADGREPPAPEDPPAIAIQRPVAGSEHGAGPVTAEGQATVYEGTVLLTLVGPDGSVVEEAFATATAGAPERGRWSHTFATAADAPGRWQVVAAAPDPSDGEGRPPARTVTEFHVMGGG